MRTQKVLLLLGLLFLAHPGFAKETRLDQDLQIGRITQMEYAKMWGYRRFAPQRLPERYRDLLSVPLKCGTPLIAFLKENWNRLNTEDRQSFQSILQRPSLNYTTLSPEGLFKIHYNKTGYQAVPPEDKNQNGIPDYVEEAGRVLDRCYHLEIDTLGFHSPPEDDPLDPQIDVYFVDSDGGKIDYGETRWDDDGSPVAAYMLLNNDFSEDYLATRGLDGLRVTIAHEFFHVIQLGYVVRSMDFYFYEMCSTWMEDFAYDDINDYYQYLPYFFRSPDKPLSYGAAGSIRPYGASIFIKFLEEYYTPKLLHGIWEHMVEVNSMYATDLTLKENGSSLAAAFSWFSVWNYFTGTRAIPGRFYEEAAYYPEITVTDSVLFNSEVLVSDTSYFLSSKYHNLRANTAGSYTLMQNHEDDTIWRGAVVLNRPDPLIFADILPQTLQDIGLVSSNEKILLISSNVSIPDKLDLYLYQYDEAIGQFIVKGIEFTGEGKVFPNPYLPGQHNVIKMYFKAPGTDNVQFSVLTQTGRPVFAHEIGMIQKGTAVIQVRWTGTDKNGEPLPSGVYLAMVQGEKYHILQKFILVR